jgi:hypothetical protein
MMVEMGSSNTPIQTMSPDRLRGRVMSVYSMMFMGMAPFGAVFGWRWPGLRTEARRLIAAAQMAGGVPPQSGTGGSVAVK